MTGRKDLFQQAMSQGHSAAWDQQWDRAARFYQQALEEFPDDAKALLSLGLALFELRDYEQALAVYRRAAKASPEDPIPLEKVSQILELMGQAEEACEVAMQAANLYLTKGDAGKAIENWSRVTRISPDDLPARSRLAQVHERLGRKSQAVTEYLVVASLFQHSGRKREALQVINHALKISPTSDEARQALTMLQNNQPLPKPVRPRVVLRAGEEEPSVGQLEAPKTPADEAQNLDPIAAARKRALAELANVLFELSEYKEEEQPGRRALQELTQGRELRGRDRGERANLIYRLRQAVDLQTREQDDQAVEELEQVLELGLDLPAVYFGLGMLYTRRGQTEEAVRYLQRAIKSADYALAARLLRGELMQKHGRLKEAAVEYLEALKIADSHLAPPEHAAALRQLYEPLIEAHAQEANDEAHELLCANIAELLIRPNWRDNLARARRELPQREDGAPPVPLAEMLTQARSGQIVSALSAIHQYARAGQLRLATEEAFRALDFAPAYLPLHVLLGELLLQQELVDEAIIKLTVVARAYSSRGESARAIDLLRRVAQLAPMDLEIRQTIIDQLISSGDIEAALQEYLDVAEAYIRLADLEHARGVFAEALRLAERSKVDRKWSVTLLHQMADINLQRLDWRQALRTYEQIRDLAPGDENARTRLIELNLRMGQEAQSLRELDNYLGYLQSNSRPETAVEVLEYLVQNHPDNASLRQRLARGYEGAGRVVDAIAAWDQVGEMLLDAGDRSGAISAIRAIIALNPPNVEDYRRLLGELGG